MQQEWESVTSDGTLKRYPVPGGWVYVTFTYIPAVFGELGVEQNDYWQLSSSCFVPSYD